MLLSIIIPVYNRPKEVDELLSSLAQQEDKNFEVVIVEDGSVEKCDRVVDKYKTLLPLKYFYKPNTGPGTTRNFGVQKCSGDYLIFLDSDCIAPKNYMKEIKTELLNNHMDVFGGPDKAHDSFSTIQKAINYAMTSPITTGGIRGRKRGLDKFIPRSFNMGVRREVFCTLGGFSDMRFGEDIDFSYRIIHNNYQSILLSDAWVYHKRRTNFKQFFKQVFNSGIARIVLTNRHRGTLKVVYILPAVFTMGCFLIIVGSLFYPILILGIVLFTSLLFVDATIRTRSIKTGAASVVASFVQLIGYGSGFISALWKMGIRKYRSYTAFTKNLYK